MGDGAGVPAPRVAGREEEEERDLNKALGVERFQQILHPAPRGPAEQHRVYNEEDFEYHRHSSHHIHHPLSMHLAPDGRKKKGNKKKKGAGRRRGSASSSAATIEEDEEEDEAEEESCSQHDGEGHPTTPTPDTDTDTQTGEVQFFVSEDDHSSSSASKSGTRTPPRRLDIVPESALRKDSIPEDATPTDEPEPAPSHHKGSNGLYDLQERRRTGNMTGAELARYQRIPTDESEAQTLASADLDGIKSHRFEDVPGVRRHLVRKSTKGQVVHISKDHKEPSTRSRKLDRTPHEVFVELNELIMDKNQEMQWRETARWIKFEEDVEEETDRWGKPHVASLSFRSLLELRKTISHGAVLLDLDQKSLPGIAHQVVEQMIISDQIKAEDRANVLRALLLKHSHPSDEKDHGSGFPRNISAASLGSLMVHHHSANHIAQTEPSVTDPLMGTGGGIGSETDARIDMEKNEKEMPPVLGMHRSKSKHELKLLEKIPENAEATVVLVGSVDFLDQPTMAFVRLQEAHQIG
ncbi:hypothetical protein ANANG_G00171220 [Anguilla anguilla]|uniref:Band 3 cytoplasmic domain-containing protein n=1 Tax=Anguilla anguilla TaxID=7936 RepID=A0A9D3MA80_ANGAN|nr:hypothetical protein ANANG_G00171220 [Anguilla anguilla]